MFTKLITKARSSLHSKAGITGVSITILGIILATVITIFSLTKSKTSLSDSIESISTHLDDFNIKLEMLSAMEDRWLQINNMSVDSFTEAENKTTKYGKYKVSETYGKLGKYNTDTGECINSTPSDIDKLCRTVTLSVKKDGENFPFEPIETTRTAVIKQENEWITETITENKTFTCPVTGNYEFIAIGGGGGGAGGICVNNSSLSLMIMSGGGSGGDGGRYIGKHFLKKGTQVSISIGKGGSAGVHSDLQGSSYVGNYSAQSAGGDGSNTVITINGVQYIGYGGARGYGFYSGGYGGAGGLGTLTGFHGSAGSVHLHGYGQSGCNGARGGTGYGAGGSGGTGFQTYTTCMSYNGYAGTQGEVIIMYQKASD